MVCIVRPILMGVRSRHLKSAHSLDFGLLVIFVDSGSGVGDAWGKVMSSWIWDEGVVHGVYDHSLERMLAKRG